MGAGHRILRDVIELSGLLTRLDTTHGTTDIDTADTLVLVVTRQPAAMRASYAYHWEGRDEAIPIAVSLRGIAKRYPYAERVSYEQLCAQPDAVIFRVAALLRIPPWPCPLDLVNQNAKWRSTGRLPDGLVGARIAGSD